MMSSRPVRYGSSAGALLLLFAVNIPVASAQALGDVAQREAERRKQVTSGRVYTNADLAPADGSVSSQTPVLVQTATGSGAAAPDASPSGQEAQPANEGGGEAIIVKGREKRDEQYWRSLAKQLRERLAKTTADIAATEARISEIDGSPQTPTLVREREVISETLVALQRSARYRSEELARFVAKARVAKVPDEWIR